MPANSAFCRAIAQRCTCTESTNLWLAPRLPQSPPQISLCFLASLPRKAKSLARDVFDQVASKPIVMHAHGFELGCPLMIEPRLPRLASVGLVGHELDAGGGCISDDYEHFAARHRLEQRKIVDRLKACEARVLPHGVGVEVALLFLV